MSHAVIVCEGYQDRQFISEWLDRRGMSRADKHALPFKDTFEKVSPTGLRISILPAMGKERVLPMLKRFRGLYPSPVAWLVVTDTDGVDPVDAAENLRRAVDGAFPGDPSISVALWHPILEGVIETALRRVYADRIAQVSTFLDSRVDPPPRSGKETARVYCAAWQTAFFGDAFYRQVLLDDRLRPEIESQLTEFSAQIDRLLALK